MKALKDMKEIIEDEIKKIAKKGDISPQELDSVYKAVDVLKDIDDLCRNEEMGMSYDGEYSNEGYSRNYSREGEYSNRMYKPMSYDGSIWNKSYDGRAGRDADNDGRYSERGGYDDYSRGRYSSRDGGSYNSNRGYSRHTEKERMVDLLKMMSKDTNDPMVKSTIEQAMQKLEG